MEGCLRRRVIRGGKLKLRNNEEALCGVWSMFIGNVVVIASFDYGLTEARRPVSPDAEYTNGQPRGVEFNRRCSCAAHTIPYSVHNGVVLVAGVL